MQSCGAGIAGSGTCGGNISQQSRSAGSCARAGREMPPGGSHRRPSGVSSPGDAKEITRGERRDEAEHLSSTTPGARAAGLGGGATAGFRGHVGWCTGGRRRDVALCRRARHPRPLSGHPRAHCLPQPHKGQPHRWFPTTCAPPTRGVPAPLLRSPRLRRLVTPRLRSGIPPFAESPAPRPLRDRLPLFRFGLAPSSHFREAPRPRS